MYSSPNIIRHIKSRIIKWMGHVARMGEERKVCSVLVGKPEERDHSEDRERDGRMVPECILRRSAGWGRVAPAGSE
jgi:hypothetical protein